jgi:hypothetical protein
LELLFSNENQEDDNDNIENMEETITPTTTTPMQTIEKIFDNYP